jgi:hypothetical protein
MNFRFMLMHELAEMNMAIRLVIVNTQNMLTVQKLTLPALMRSLYFLDGPSFLLNFVKQKLRE